MSFHFNFSLNLLPVRISLLLFTFVFKIFTDPGLHKIRHSSLVCRCGFAFSSSFEIHMCTRIFEETRREGSAVRGASPRNFARARVYFARLTIAIAKIRDSSQSTILRYHKIFVYKQWIIIPNRVRRLNCSL